MNIPEQPTNADDKNKTPDVIIKLEDYAYMDELTTAGWAWEFIRRNENYREAFEWLSLIYSKKPLDLTIKQFKQDMDEIAAAIVKDFYIKPHYTGASEDKLKGYLLIRCRQNKELIKGNLAIPDPKFRYNEFQKKYKPAIMEFDPIRQFKFTEKLLKRYETDQQNFNKRCFHIINRKLIATTNLTDTLFVGISLNAKKEELEFALSELIKKKVKGKSLYLRDEWKDYLIAHDARTIYMKYKDIANLFNRSDIDYHKAIIYCGRAKQLIENYKEEMFDKIKKIRKRLTK